MKLKRRHFNKYTTLILTLLGLGVFGAIFFFPVNINNQYTCLYHRLFYPGHSYTHAIGTDVPQTQQEYLLNRYLSPFGLLWWGSLLLTALSIYSLKRQSSLNPINRRSIRRH